MSATLSVVPHTFFFRLILLIHTLSKRATRRTDVSVPRSTLSSLHDVLLLATREVLRGRIIVVLIVFLVFLDLVSMMDDSVVVVLISDYLVEPLVACWNIGHLAAARGCLIPHQPWLLMVRLASSSGALIVSDVSVEMTVITTTFLCLA